MVVVLVLGGLSYANIGRTGGGWSGSGEGWSFLGSGAPRPTPVRATTTTPLGTPPPAPDQPGGFGFIATQSDGETPVAYDPCRPIHVVVNRRTAPSIAARLLEESLDEITARTGLTFVLEGFTSEPAVEERPPFQPDRYGDRWAPVLVAWTDPDELPELAGEIVGLGGSSWLEHESGTSVFVSGMVYLDGPDFAEILRHPDGWQQARAIMLHELGHLVGLDHVDDQRQLMHHRSHRFVVDFGSGDLAGLARLGSGTCVDRL